MKKFICFTLSFLLIFSSNTTFASRKRAAKGKRSVSKVNLKKSSSQKSTQSLPPQQQINTNEETPLTCAEKYNFCMDNICINEQGVRYSCATSLDSFETVVRDGEEFRVGNDLYTFAKGTCADTLKSCELAERNRIETSYKAQINEDLLMKNYLDAMNAQSDETQQVLLEQYAACMGEVCGVNYTDCMTIANVERRSPTCEGILSSSSRPLSVKKMFYDKLIEMRAEFCKNTGGYVDYDSKICKVSVSFGSLELAVDKESGMQYPTGKMSKEVAKRTFNVGEMVECTEDYFKTSNTEKLSLFDGMKDIVFGGVRAISGIVVAVVGAVGTVFSGGATSGMITNGLGMVMKGSAQTLNGAVKINTDTKVASGCFINNQLVANMNTYFKINFSYQ